MAPAPAALQLGTREAQVGQLEGGDQLLGEQFATASFVGERREGPDQIEIARIAPIAGLVPEDGEGDLARYAIARLIARKRRGELAVERAPLVDMGLIDMGSAVGREFHEAGRADPGRPAGLRPIEPDHAIVEGEARRLAIIGGWPDAGGDRARPELLQEEREAAILGADCRFCLRRRERHRRSRRAILGRRDLRRKQQGCEGEKTAHGDPAAHNVTSPARNP